MPSSRRPPFVRPWLVPVGGFLGAGKTTLILASARILAARSLRCAAILNDQGDHLVDTAFTATQGIAADEVAGGCFCCRFSDLIAAADRLQELAPDVIFIEPVGSCTDLAATVLRPLKQDFVDLYRIAPLTVLVDPEQALRVQVGAADPNIRYLFEHQLAEADIVAFNKCDLHSSTPSLPGTNARRLSAINGTGVAAWLDEVLSGEITAGTKELDIDYRDYAAAEAALAWLNWSAIVETEPPLSAAQLVGPFVDDVQQALIAAGAEIAHFKAFAQSEGNCLKISLTANDTDPIAEGDLTASPSRRHDLRVNIRAVLDPPALQRIFRTALDQLPVAWREEHFQCFSPAAPFKPAVVDARRSVIL